MRLILLTFFILLFFSFSVPAYAQCPPACGEVKAEATFQPLVGIPGVSAASPDIGQYVNALYILAITVGGLLAVAKIVLGGVQYMFSDVVTDKSEAKRSIFGAIIGLLIILSTFVVLGEVNSNLTNLSVLDAGRVLQLQSAGQGEKPKKTLDETFNCPAGTTFRAIAVEPGYECVKKSIPKAENLRCDGTAIPDGTFECPCNYTINVDASGRGFSCDRDAPPVPDF